MNYDNSNNTTNIAQLITFTRGEFLGLVIMQSTTIVKTILAYFIYVVFNVSVLYTLRYYMRNNNVRKLCINWFEI